MLASFGQLGLVGDTTYLFQVYAKNNPCHAE